MGKRNQFSFNFDNFFFISFNFPEFRSILFETKMNKFAAETETEIEKKFTYRICLVSTNVIEMLRQVL